MKLLFCIIMSPVMVAATISDIIHGRKEWLGCSTQRLGAWMLERMDKWWPTAPRTGRLATPWWAK